MDSVRRNNSTADVSMAYNFQIGENKIKLHAEYENVNQTVLLHIESILHNPKQCQHALFS
jgi:hypothetical protein